jgi:GNAT superfamily N-acetyltransferase
MAGVETEIVAIGADRLDELEPLWMELFDHHAGIAEGVAPVRDRDESWRMRRRQYERWLEAGEVTILLALREGRAVGYITVTFADPPPSWDIGAVGTVETMSVLSAARGGGVGARLMEEVRRIASERGAQTLQVGLAHTNDGARRFYEREGFRPFYLELIAPVKR